MSSPSVQRRKNKNASQGQLWKDWKNNGGICQIPRQVLMSEDYISLNHASVRVLMALVSQYNGANNGDLCATQSEMAKHGIKSPDTLTRTLKELLQRGMIVKTRSGISGVNGHRLCTLYALSWLAVDEIGKKFGSKWITEIRGTKTALRLDFSKPHDGEFKYQTA
ncbi:MAG: hypothetical protein EOM46_00065 [Gammaproteobacteria bacterium]|nr:hypothetical protein [Gammaproteobacteria bacterium]